MGACVNYCVYIQYRQTTQHLLGDTMKYQYCDFYSAKPHRAAEWLRRLMLWF